MIYAADTTTSLELDAADRDSVPLQETLPHSSAPRDRAKKPAGEPESPALLKAVSENGSLSL